MAADAALAAALFSAALFSLSLRLADGVCDVLIFGGMLIRTWYVLGGLLLVTAGR